MGRRPEPNQSSGAALFFLAGPSGESSGRRTALMAREVQPSEIPAPAFTAIRYPFTSIADGGMGPPRSLKLDALCTDRTRGMRLPGYGGSIVRRERASSRSAAAARRGRLFGVRRIPPQVASRDDAREERPEARPYRSRSAKAMILRDFLHQPLREGLVPRRGVFPYQRKL